MKANTHPKYYEESQVTCACGNSFKVAASKPQFFIEVCYKCHPLFTGEERMVDIKGQVEKYRSKMEFAKQYKAKHPKKEKKNKERGANKSLKDLLAEG